MRTLSLSLVMLFVAVMSSPATAAIISVTGPAGPVEPGESVSVDVHLDTEGVAIDAFAFSLTSNGVAVSGANVMVLDLPLPAPVPNGSDIAPFGQAKFPLPAVPVNAVVATATFIAGASGTLDIDAFFALTDGVVVNQVLVPTTFSGYSAGIAAVAATISVVGPAGPVAAGESVSVDIVLDTQGGVIDVFAFSLTSNGVAVSGANVMVFELPILTPVANGSDIAPFGQAKFPLPAVSVNTIVATATFTAGASGTLDINAFFDDPDGVIVDGAFVPTTFNGYSVGIALPVPALSLWPRALLGACLLATTAVFARRRS